MPRSHSRRSRTPAVVGAVLGLLIVVAAIVWAVKPGSSVPNAGHVVGFTPPPADLMPVAHVTVTTSKPHMLIIGDSWTYGQGATKPTDGYAYQVGKLLGWPTEVQGVPGTGYTKLSPYKYPDNKVFGNRLLDPSVLTYKHPQVIVIQGSLNDTHTAPVKVVTAETAAVANAKRTFPGAAIVLFAPIFEPNAPAQSIATSEEDLTIAAGREHVALIKPMTEQYFTSESQWKQLSGADKHPNQRGHDLIASKLAADLKRIVVVAKSG